MDYTGKVLLINSSGIDTHVNNIPQGSPLRDTIDATIFHLKGAARGRAMRPDVGMFRAVAGSKTC